MLLYNKIRKNIRKHSSNKRKEESNASLLPIQMILPAGPGSCYVPFCPSSYGFGKSKKPRPPKWLTLKKEHHIMFAVPLNTLQFLEWERNIPKRAEVKLKSRSHRICSSHFRKEDFFEKPYVAIVDTGDKVKLENKNVTYLKPNSVPVYFKNPGIPKYLLKNHFKRKPPKERLPLLPLKKIQKTQEKHEDSSNESSELIFETNYEDCEMYESNEIVTPSSSPVMFEPYTPMYADSEINFIDPENIPDNSIYREQPIPSKPSLNDSSSHEFNEKLPQVSPKPSCIEKQKQKSTPLSNYKNVSCYSSTDLLDCEPPSPSQSLSPAREDIEDETNSTKQIKRNVSKKLVAITKTHANKKTKFNKEDQLQNTPRPANVSVKINKLLLSSQHALTLRPVSSEETKGKNVILIKPTMSGSRGVLAFKPIAPKPSISQKKTCLLSSLLKPINFKLQTSIREKMSGILQTTAFKITNDQNAQFKANSIAISTENKPSTLEKSQKLSTTVNWNVDNNSSESILKDTIPHSTQTREHNYQNKLLAKTSNKKTNLCSTSNSVPAVNIVKPTRTVPDIVDIPLKFETLAESCLELQLPSSHWALQRSESNSFISISYVDVIASGNLSDKRIMFQGSMKPKVWFDGSYQNSFSTVVINNLRDLNEFIANIAAMTPCLGTRNPTCPYSTTCMVYKHPKKYTCLACARTIRYLQSRDFKQEKKKKKTLKIQSNAKKDTIKKDNSQMEQEVYSQAVASGMETELLLEDAIMAASNAELAAEEQKLLSSIGLISNI